MNERIKELAEQAGNTLVYGPFGGVDVAFNTEKFAELLVKECSDVAANAHGIREAQGHSVSKQIKEHFGVEE